MEYSTNLPEDLHDSYFDEINSYVAGFVSLVANILLIYATSKVQMYSDSVRRMQYYVCILRLIFSLTVVLTSPTLCYVASVKTLYIVKGSFFIPIPFGITALLIFVTFVVISCSSPAVQYVQVLQLLSDKSHLHERYGPFVLAFSLLSGIPALILASIGYTPTIEEYMRSKDIVYWLNGEGESAFLIIPLRTKSPNSKPWIIWVSKICTFYIMTIMILSVIVVVICFVKIQLLMRKKMASSSTTNKTKISAQKQLNVVLFVQFILPFLTIHIPFYISFILPIFDYENTFLSNNLPFLFSWCPAINPILVIVFVKNIRDRVICPRSTSKVNSSNVIQIRNSKY